MPSAPRWLSRVAELLYGLCKGIVTPPQAGRGQRRHLLSDMVFAAAMKVYAASSARRFATDLLEYTAKDYLTRAPHYNSIFVYFEDETLTPLLKTLIEESARPLAVVESNVAIDATGFSVSTKDNYFEAKHEHAKQRRKFVKLHAMVGTTTHIITAAHVTEGNENDSPYLPSLLASTTERFKVHEVSADKGYLSRNNLNEILDKGAMPFIPFKSNSNADGDDRTWNTLYHYFHYKRDEFLKHYHQRSNVETVFSMMKAKFGPALRSKTDVAQKNEVYLKVLCHNLCCLVKAIFELGIEPEFWPETAPADVKVTA
jgi:transposase